MSIASCLWSADAASFEERRNMVTNICDSICSVSIETAPPSLNPAFEGEVKVAISDLLQRNTFGLVGYDLGPYQLFLTRSDSKLIFRVANSAGRELVSHCVSARPLQKILNDYRAIFEVFFEAARAGLHHSRLEAIDVARRALHDEGAKLLSGRISSRIHVDFETARRLFTLVHVIVP